jgi:hypothetical protein
MDAPGSYFLLIGGTDFNITNPGTYTGDWQADLEGMVSCSVQLDFRAGTGGTDVRAYLQTTLDDGNTAIDLACALFTASERRVLNFASTITTSVPTTATDGALADNTILFASGVLGTRLRLKLISTGTWTNTYLGGRMVVR